MADASGTTPQWRYLVTDTSEVRGALAEAASHWPDLDSSELLQRLVSEGGAALRASAAHQAMIDLVISSSMGDEE